MKKLFAASIILVCMICYATAQIIHVPGDQPSIQAGIDAAIDGDTVLVADSTYYENINFRGKAITVASHFLIDRDTSHISKTIIDGSQPHHPDTASVVSMVSGEDTTSVLIGFTLKGGKGSFVLIKEYFNYYQLGGGVNVQYSGGKIEHNIIEDNHLIDGPKEFIALGSGIFANVPNNRTVIIRNNLIRNNTFIGKDGAGGGMFLGNGNFIIEGNTISANIINGISYPGGSGIFYQRFGYRETIPKVIIRNNIIAENELYGKIYPWGAGIKLLGDYTLDLDLQIYNNLIYNCNTHEGWGGGIGMYGIKRAVIFNNTIVNNWAEYEGKQLHLWYDTKVILFNNILWSDSDDGISEIRLEPNSNNLLFANYNNIRGGWEGSGNINKDPGFAADTFLLTQWSPCIGWGLDSVQVEKTWYFAHASDLSGNNRPDPVDPYVDIGAFESVFPRPILHNAYLAYIGLWNRKLLPDFNKDTLHYVLPVIDTTTVTPQLDVIPEDRIAEVDIDHAADITSPDPVNRTTTITVTADDGTTQKLYTVLFRYASADATLSELATKKGSLDPDFHSDSLIYTVCLLTGETTTPFLIYETADPFASVEVLPASNILSNFRFSRTTTINVTAEDGIKKETYKIEFNVKDFCATGIPKSLYKDMSLYPNPFNNYLTIETSDIGPHSIEITSLNGQLLYSSKSEGPIQQIDLSSFQKGVYFITVRSGDFVRTGKIIKL